MDFFKYRKNRLYCENVPVERIIKRTGTPVYIYSGRTVLTHWRRLRSAFAAAGNPLISYSLKANSNLALCKLLKRAGSAFEVVSGGELFRLIKIGVPGRRIIFGGVAKTADEIKLGLRHGVLMFNVETRDEVMLINRVAARLKKTASVALRLNPEVAPSTHRYLTTGQKGNKFGFYLPDAERLMKEMLALKHISLVGLHMHIGSQIIRVSPYRTALKRVVKFLEKCRAFGHPIRWLDIGGGFGIYYHGHEARPARVFARALMPLIKKTGCRLIVEPGRFIVGNAGILVTRVLSVKKSGAKYFVICDAGMNTLLRPALYGAYHKIGPVTRRPGRTVLTADVVGPICESGDFFAKKRRLPAVKPGEYLAVFSAGAYGFTMSSTYNSRPRPAEILVNGSKYQIVRKSETYQDLIRLDRY
ncbi:MAG: diaminopimelate decarboxylase [Planctomycetes bacterium]|nr:diaminopimelate decarboxylase [Planctomycetota bacterium]